MKPEAAIGQILRTKHKSIAVAESCTGGTISNRITDISGSSDYFILGIVAYSNGAKESLLGVSGKLIRKYGSVSKEVAHEMALGIRRAAAADIGVGVTGIAGPKGGTSSKPVGLVYIAFVSDEKHIVKEFHFKGSRHKIKLQASQAALDLVRRNA